MCPQFGPPARPALHDLKAQDSSIAPPAYLTDASFSAPQQSARDCETALGRCGQVLLRQQQQQQEEVEAEAKEEEEEEEGKISKQSRHAATIKRPDGQVLTHWWSGAAEAERQHVEEGRGRQHGQVIPHTHRHLHLRKASRPGHTTAPPY